MQISTRDNSKIELSIITSMYFSAPYLEEFMTRIRAEAEKITPHYEIILVNDGSPDDSLKTALSLQSNDSRIRIVDLSRNFGQHKAMMCGLRFAKGEIVFLTDCDLEEAPELLGKFNDERLKAEADAVYGVQDTRQGSLYKRICGRLFYALLNLLNDFPIPSDLLCSRLMTRRYVDSLLMHNEREIFIAGLYVNTGYHQVQLKVTKSFKGATSYSLRKKISMAVEGVVSFSNRPLYYIFYLGIGMMILSGSASLWLIIRRIFNSHYLLGWPSLITSIWFLGGITIFCMGVIGIYLSKIFSEVKQRPTSIVRNVYEMQINNHGLPQAPHFPNHLSCENEMFAVTKVHE